MLAINCSKKHSQAVEKRGRLLSDGTATSSTALESHGFVRMSQAEQYGALAAHLASCSIPLYSLEKLLTSDFIQLVAHLPEVSGTFRWWGEDVSIAAIDPAFPDASLCGGFEFGSSGTTARSNLVRGSDEVASRALQRIRHHPFVLIVDESTKRVQLDTTCVTVLVARTWCETVLLDAVVDPAHQHPASWWRSTWRKQCDLGAWQ